MAETKNTIRSYDFDVLEPFFYTAGVQGPQVLKSMQQFKDFSDAPDMRKAVAVPKVSQVAIDDYKSGNPSPYTMKYLVHIFSQFGQGFEFDDWLENATLQYKPFSELWVDNPE